MSAITRDPDGPNREAVFRVDWRVLEATSIDPRRWLVLLRPSVPPDPYLVSRALSHLMGLCDVRSVDRRPLIWNQYSLYLETSDWQGLRALEAHIARELRGYLQEALSSRGAVIVGDFNVDLLRDESAKVKRGQTVIWAEYRSQTGRPRGNLEEVTVRFDRPGPPSLTDVDTARTPGASLGQPVVPAGGAALGVVVRLVLRDGREVELPGGRRFVLGRVHADCPRNFIALPDADSGVSRRLFWVEPSATGVLVGRFPNTTELSVNGRPLQPGGQIEVLTFPVSIAGSQDVVLARLER
jgi:hypothetical protein